MSAVLLFVYGTLKRGRKNHRLIAGQEFIGPARTEPRYRLFDCGPHPALVADNDGIGVQGELYRVDEEELPDLDAFEEVPTLFQREEIRLENVPGPVFAYLYVPDVSRLKECGTIWPEN